LIRILLLFVLGYVAWRALKGMITPGGQAGAGGDESASPAMDADMVQDPRCGVYVTREEAVRAEIDGRQVFFCSRKCKEDYIAGRKAGR